MHAAQNQILINSQFNAIIDGTPTGLAGCLNAGACTRAALCMRSDERLPCRAVFSTSTEDCNVFIGWAAK